MDATGDTARLEAEIAALKKQNELMLTIFDHISEAVYAVDEDDRIVLYNSQVERTENKKRAEMLGKDEKRVYRFDETTFNDQVTQYVKNSGKPLLQTVLRYHMEDGRQVAIFVNSYPFFYEGEYSGVYTIGQDLVHVNKVYDNLILRQQKLLKAVEDKTYKGGMSYELDDIVGRSQPMQDVISLARRVAVKDSSIMIVGETGTGKEMFAQGIHYASHYRNGPFVPINCAAIPETLLESILFGSVKGAFTGAVDMPGLFEQAEGGTIFLDEINSMSQGLQAKLLRVLQDKKIRRVGSQKEYTVNCRIVSASNANLSDKEDFRSDLFFRLAVITLNLPSLRQRRDDILLLTSFFIGQFNRRFATCVEEVDDELKRVLYFYDWPGNVRELENLVECAMNFVDKDDTRLRFEHLPDFFQGKLLYTRINVAGNGEEDTRPKMTLRESVQDFEKQMILETLRRNNWNISRSARDLGLQRQNLQAKLKHYDIVKP